MLANKPSSLYLYQLIGRPETRVLIAAALLMCAMPRGHADDIGPETGRQRRRRAYEIRFEAAQAIRRAPLREHPDNGDDERYANRIGSFTKALPHSERGEVKPEAYDALLDALRSGAHSAFEAIPMGGPLKLANPQAAYVYTMDGADVSQYSIPSAPSLRSAELAVEAVELYWQALTRDVPFSQYASDPTIQRAAADLSRFPRFRGPTRHGTVTPGTIFRGPTPGDLNGPYISQFLLKDIPHGSTMIPQRYRVTLPNDDHLTDPEGWLKVQNGQPPPKPNAYDPTPRYIRNGRDLGEYDHKDFTYQAFLDAGLMLWGMKAPMDQNNPYSKSATQAGFVTFGAPEMLDLVARAANAALKAAWYQKWLVHRRLRPEEFGGLVQRHRTGSASYPFHQSIFTSPVLDAVFAKHGSYLLPMAYAEGSPIHPAYPAGHAAIAGACITMLKAFFDESAVMADPVVANADGTALLPYTGPPLTVGGELDKLASNIAIARDTAGVHWRSDAIEGIKLGEKVAIKILQEMVPCANETFNGYAITRYGTNTTLLVRPAGTAALAIDQTGPDERRVPQSVRGRSSPSTDQLPEPTP